MTQSLNDTLILVAQFHPNDTVVNWASVIDYKTKDQINYQ